MTPRRLEESVIRIQVLLAPHDHPARNTEIQVTDPLEAGRLVAILAALYPELAPALPPRRDDVTLGLYLKVVCNGRRVEMTELLMDGDLVQIGRGSERSHTNRGGTRA